MAQLNKRRDIIYAQPNHYLKLCGTFPNEPQGHTNDNQIIRPQGTQDDPFDCAAADVNDNVTLSALRLV